MDVLQGVWLGLQIALTPEFLFYAFLGCFVGTLVGVLPGVGSAGGMIILLPLTMALPPARAITMLAGIFYGSYYGGTISTILMNVPGEVASVVIMRDGNQLAKQGKGGIALAIAAIGSFVGGTVAVLCLIALAPLLSDVALSFGAPEFFALMILGVSTLMLLSGGAVWKSLIMACIGLIIGLIGMDPTTGIPRFTFGTVQLLGGLNFVPVMMGLFGLSEVLLASEEPPRQVNRNAIRKIYPGKAELKETAAPIARGSLVGIFLGLIPGTTQTLASFLSYNLEKGVSKKPEAFGNGSLAAVAGPETANNAHANAALIPLFTLGIPGSPSIAILLGAFIMNGLAPGPFLFSEHPEIVWPIIMSVVTGNIILLILNVPLVGMWVRILEIPNRYLTPFIIFFICLGAYLTANSVFDVGVTLFFGMLGVVLRKLAFPLAPLALTMILGPMMENSLRQSLSISKGDLWILLSSPVSCIFLGLAAAILMLPAVRSLRQGGLGVLRSDANGES